jgi:1,2-phenylacetyl-CoA epoxidase catalytic subunit
MNTDPRYLATVEKLLRSQAYRERGAADLFERGLPLAPDDRWRKVLAAHVLEERSHYAQVRVLWSTTFKRPQAELDTWVAARLAEHPLPQLTSWLDVAMALFLFDRAGRWQLSEYLGSSFLPYRALAREIVEDERGHEDAGARLVVELCQAPGADLRAAQATFDRWLGVALLSFGRAGTEGNAFAIAAGLKTRDSSAVTRDFLNDIKATTRAAGL